MSTEAGEDQLVEKGHLRRTLLPAGWGKCWEQWCFGITTEAVKFERLGHGKKKGSNAVFVFEAADSCYSLVSGKITADLSFFAWGQIWSRAVWTAPSSQVQTRSVFPRSAAALPALIEGRSSATDGDRHAAELSVAAY